MPNKTVCLSQGRETLTIIVLGPTGLPVPGVTISGVCNYESFWNGSRMINNAKAITGTDGVAGFAIDGDPNPGIPKPFTNNFSFTASVAGCGTLTTTYTYTVNNCF